MGKSNNGIITDIILGAIMLTGAMYLYYKFMVDDSAVNANTMLPEITNPNIQAPETGAPETPVINIIVNEVDDEPCLFPGEMFIDNSLTDMRPDYGYMQ